MINPELKAIERANRKAWTLANIRAANEAAGFYFFSRDTQKFFGDTMRSFSVSCEGAEIYVTRVRAPAKAPDAAMARRMIGERRLFDPETGAIGCVIREPADA